MSLWHSGAGRGGRGAGGREPIGSELVQRTEYNQERYLILKNINVPELKKMCEGKANGGVKYKSLLKAELIIHMLTLDESYGALTPRPPIVAEMGIGK